MSPRADPPSPTLAVYYGPATEQALATLATFPRVAVQAPLYSPEQLAALRRGGTRVLAYLSVGEDHPLGDWACVPGAAPYHQQPNTEWASVVVDAAHPLWADVLLTRAAQILEHTDGLLLDTLDSADPVATLALLRQLRGAFPDAALWANRGFALWPELPEVLRGAPDHGVLFEALSTRHTPCYALHDPPGLAYTAHWLAEVRRSGLPVHALDYADRPELAAAARARAAALGLRTFVSDRDLVWPGGWPIPEPVGPTPLEALL
ncbi:hypothetical protein [Deinococcus wulumuqiensis]|uniref:Glycoside-hydrolase family GH114 TIM-barrel domain-containing protein n=1 Tax=Deinococcus wulumuqiensis TaxID=980427 RepID=A0AAV4K579_9DEIO|nr:hypothetical protein [Deinococcus wulumuqiensis]QII20792.1 hypothetical protein G6R31_08510 [Deinococcus wulumuqiensis R12]GGI80210.1 hypothetical protein GCM10010914_13020 [Deinococcus wulumuqiensis]GGP29380.1 hypothetical protein GCM10008021_10310 [Deinococcus wulumuqiensis]